MSFTKNYVNEVEWKLFHNLIGFTYNTETVKTEFVPT